MSVVFKTPGSIPLEAFTMFGVNDKPNTDNPFGYYGTGLKYGIAVILRNGGKIKMIVDRTEYEFFIEGLDFRTKHFNRIAMRVRKWPGRFWSKTSLPYTTELGKTWLPWQAMRELLANTMDENGSDWHVEENVKIDELYSAENAEAGCTYIIVSDFPMFDDAYLNKDTFFLDKKALAPLLLETIDGIEVYDVASTGIYYKGFLVTGFSAGTTSRLTYNFLTNVDLTEDRTSKYPYVDSTRIVSALWKAQNEKIADAISQVATYQSKISNVWENSLNWDTYNPPKETAALPMRIAALGRKNQLTPRFSTAYTNHMAPPVFSINDSTVVAIPNWACIRMLEMPEFASFHARIEGALKKSGWDGKLTVAGSASVTTSETEDYDF